ncbi:hypothetical protein O9Z70_08160 [Devosia sp. YIM 151766]|uniref:hypothetical protein n=1 Tax=Devosia sp. YIM 151766 TaxID=3017325 RepID=UPI00255C4C82|nr:hypothetical protein [Devosia sp. YIM 151766]WIY51468.1 hypothetical protein O9Z70_08160 [Devosia sp. YIM 151766]
MAILMPALFRAKNGDWFARKVIPPDVRDAYQRAYGIRQEERFRLTTDKSSGEAKAAFAQWVADVEGRIAALRSAASGEALELSHRELHDLAGRWYDWFIAQHTDGDASVEVWDHHYERYQDALSRFNSAHEEDEPDEAATRSPRVAAYMQATVQELSRLPTFLAGEGVALSPISHAALVDTVERDLLAAMALLRRRAGGDYRPDQHRERFPKAVPVNPANVKLSGWNAWEAFEAWVKERQPAVATVNRWRAVFMDLNAFLEKRDIALMTDDDAVAWKDKLAATAGLGGRTVNEIWLTGARTVFNWVKKQKKLTSNPLDGVKVAVARSGPTRGKFQEEDAETILKATFIPLGPRTSEHLKLAVRWVPWLCAYTGARSGEMTQLRKQDIERHKDGFWLVHITPDAGTVKGSMPRTVVLHDHLIEQGFIEFVQKAKAGPLFYDLKAVKTDKPVDPLNPPRPPYVIMRQKLADWVRKLGVTDPGVGPNHGWRHTFRRRAAKAKIEERIRDAFCGHTDPKVGRRYELPDIEELAEAIKEFPRYPVEAPKRP